MSTHITDVAALRKAIKKASAVYIAAMMGNMPWHVKISKSEANDLVTNMVRDFANCEELGVFAYGIMGGRRQHPYHGRHVVPWRMKR